MALSSYKQLGRSGLRVSPMSLDTMTFGSDWGWGADMAEARRIFDLYIDRGGNFIDTAVNYTDGAAECFVGEFIRDKREQLVIATKFTMAREPGNPNSGGNHRLNMMRSVEQSLRQLGTDRIVPLYLHGWDMTTRSDEVMRGLDDLRGWSPFVALQIEYTLVERTVEHELMPMAAALGLGVLPWSPLGGVLLANPAVVSPVMGAAPSPRPRTISALWTWCCRPSSRSARSGERSRSHIPGALR